MSICVSIMLIAKFKWALHPFVMLELGICTGLIGIANGKINIHCEKKKVFSVSAKN